MDSNEKYQINTCMELNIKLIRNFGCWPRFYNIHKTSERLYLLYCALMLGSSIIFLGEQSYGMILYSYQWHSISDALEDASMYLSAVVVTTKIITVILNQKSLEKVIDRLNNHWNVKYINTEEERQMIRNGLRHEKKITSIFSVIMSGVTISYLLLSILQITRRIRETGSDFLGLKNDTASVGQFNKKIIIVKYPFQIPNMVVYILSYIHIKAVLIILVQGTICVDSITWCLLYYLCQHLAILMKKVKEDMNEKKRSGREVEKEMAEHHLELIRCVRDMQSIFGPVLLLQFTLTSFMVCLGLFQMTQIRSLGLFLAVKNFFYLVWKFTQLYMHCWYGQKLSDQSLQMTSTIYSTNWYAVSGKQTGKLLMMIRGQKPLKLTAAGCFSVSLETFMAVLQSAYSCFALLYTVEHKE